jgi:hypothetical protein
MFRQFLWRIIRLVLQHRAPWLFRTGLDTRLESQINPGFVLDSHWSKTYRNKHGKDDGTTPGVGMMYMGTGNSVVFPNNNTVLYGVTAPLQIFSQTTQNRIAEPRSRNATGTRNPGGSFALIAGNATQGGVIAVQDAVNGRVAAWRIGEGGKFEEKLWETNRYQVSAGSAVVTGKRHLYIDHRTCPDDTQTDCTIYLVVLDLESGDELARVKVAGTKPSIAKIIVGDDCVYYVASEAGEDQGFVTKVSAK